MVRFTEGIQARFPGFQTAPSRTEKWEADQWTKGPQRGDGVHAACPLLATWAWGLWAARLRGGRAQPKGSVKCHPCLEVLPIHCHCRGFKLKRKKREGAQNLVFENHSCIQLQRRAMPRISGPSGPSRCSRAATLTLISGIVLPRVRLKQVVSRGQLKCLGHNG